MPKPDVNSSKTLLLEDFVPYHASIEWLMQENYYNTRGKDAWVKGELPYFATTNSLAARQYAEIIYSSIENAEAKGALNHGDTINILEMAFGLGLFTINFLNAFREMDKTKGNKYFLRIKYYMTDLSLKNLNDASENKFIRDLQKSGIVNIAQLDMLSPEKLKFLGKKKFEETPKMSAVIANYVHVILPIKILRKKEGKYFEEHFKTSLDLSGTTKHFKSIDDVLKNPSVAREHMKKETVWKVVASDFYVNQAHKDFVEKEIGLFDPATVIYPYGSFENIEKTIHLLRDNGVILISDMGYGSKDQMIERGNSDHENFIYLVNFPFIERYADYLGFSAKRTDLLNSEIQTICIQKEKNKNLESVFKKIFIDKNINVDYSDTFWSVYWLNRGKDYQRSIRLCERLMKYDPRDADIFFQLINAYSNMGEYDKALEIARRGTKYNYFDVYDFDFKTGFVYHKMHAFKIAIPYYEKSLAKNKSEITLFDIGLCYENLKDYHEAIKYFTAALKINKNYKDATEALKRVQSGLQ